MQKTLIDQLIATYRSWAKCAAALGMTRQAFNAALKRGRLSTDAALHAANLLNIEPGAALLANATPKNPSAPVIDACPTLPQQPESEPSTPLYYVNSNQYAKSDDDQSDSSKNINNAAMHKNIHSFFSKEKQDALDLIRWVFAVARLPADSPRFAWYVSRWLVPEKIAAAKLDGTFDDLVKTCPPIDPAWLRFVPGALAEYRKFTEQYFTPPETRASSSTKAKGRNIAPLAA